MIEDIVRIMQNIGHKEKVKERMGVRALER